MALRKGTPENSTLSHPETTSHRGLTSEQRTTLGITGGTIRLLVGTESAEFIREALAEGLRARTTAFCQTLVVPAKFLDCANIRAWMWTVCD